MKAFLHFCKDLKQEKALNFVNVYNYLDIYLEIKIELNLINNQDIKLNNLYDISFN